MTRSREYRKLIVDRCTVAVRIFYERRKNVRVALGKDSVLLRIPRHCNTRQRDAYNAWCDNWIHEQWKCNPRFRATFTPFEIDDIAGIRTHDRMFEIRLAGAPNSSADIRVAGSVLALTLPRHWPSEVRNKGAYKLIHKMLASLYRQQFSERAAAIHAGRFDKPIQSVGLRNMSSKWGSCSHHGKLSLSTRLLFAPREVQDYVLLHELCHLDVLDHSPVFWQRVGALDPYYSVKEDWLRENGHLCDLAFAVTQRSMESIQLPLQS